MKKGVEKILGADTELGNILECAQARVVPNDIAARRLLAEIEGVSGFNAVVAPVSAYAYAPYAAYAPSATYAPYADHGVGGTAPAALPAYDPQDWGRKFLATNGGCFYVDLGHLEACIPEVRSARDFVAAHHASLLTARAACERANANLDEGERIVVMANSSDRHGNSWGGHLNVLISRALWEQIFERIYPALFVLAAFQVSSILYTGQGKVGAENGKPWVPFQLTQRGDFFETLLGEQTTHRRPIVNSRDEAHCGPGAGTNGLARLHIIFHDTTLTHGATYLKAGVTQLVLAMMEAGWCDPEVILDDPLAALTVWGHDCDLTARAALTGGRMVTAVEHQLLFVAAARRCVEAGDAWNVPEAEKILALWEDTLAKLERGDVRALSGRLDWAMKRGLLERLIERNPELDWRSPAIQAVDLLFASLDPAQGLYWAIEAAGGVERIVTKGDIRRAMAKPPADTRAWSRAMLLRHAGQHGVASVNWDEVRLNSSPPGGAPTIICLDDPRRFTQAQVQQQAKRERNGSEQAVSTLLTEPEGEAS